MSCYIIERHRPLLNPGAIVLADLQDVTGHNALFVTSDVMIRLNSVFRAVKPRVRGYFGVGW